MSLASSSPLRGLRVLDFSRVLAGPWCTMLLGDAGADVIKLERTITGDDTRSWGPPFLGKDGRHVTKPSSTSDAISTYFLSVNRSKQSVAIDMKKEKGQEICYRLATEWADVVVENFKVGTMERLGLGYDTLQQTNPGLVYCSITGFGNTGPLSTRPGYDVIISGMYGLMSITGDEHGDPAKVGVAITDILTGTLAQGGILAALHERHRTGLGQRVDTSLMETQLASLVNIASSSLNSPPNSPPPKRRGTGHESIVPYQTFQCKTPTDSPTRNDEYIVVGAGNDVQFQKLCQVMNLQTLASDKRFATNAGRVAHRSELIGLLQDQFKQKSRDEWVTLLEGKGFPMGPVRTVPESFQCEQAIHREMTMKMHHPLAGVVRVPGSPVKYSGINTLQSANGIQQNNEKEQGETRLCLPPPMLGEHTKDVLTDVLEMTSTDIEHLVNDSVVECWER